MSQETIQENSSPKLIDIDELDAKALLGLEDAGPAISRAQPFRRWLYDWTLNPNIAGNFQKNLDKWVAVLIVANLFALVLEHVPALFEPNKVLFHYFDVFSVCIFVLEYALRFYLAPEDEEFQRKKSPRVAYFLSPFAIIDLLAIAPFFLQAFIPIDLRALRFLRLLRILKLFRIVVPAVKEFAELNRGRSFRQKIHALVFVSEYGGKLQSIFDTFIGVWVIVSVAAVVLESVHSVHYLINLEFVILDTIAVAIFTVEYLMRMYACVEEPRFRHGFLGRLKQARSISSLIDLLAILPFFLEILLHSVLDLRFLRTFRLLRLLKLTRYNNSTKILTTVIAREWPVISASAFIMILMVVMTASLGYVFEHEAQPEKFDNIPNAVYWAVITLASVGYGDISPVTPGGRLITVVLALVGIGLFAIPAAIMASGFTDQLRMNREKLKQDLLAEARAGAFDEAARDAFIHNAKHHHLTVVEINQLIDEIEKSADSTETTSGEFESLALAAKNPEFALAQYHTLVSRLRELAAVADGAYIRQHLDKPGQATDLDRAIWQQVDRSRAGKG